MPELPCTRTATGVWKCSAFTMDESSVADGPIATIVIKKGAGMAGIPAKRSNRPTMGQLNGLVFILAGFSIAIGSDIGDSRSYWRWTGEECRISSKRSSEQMG